MAYSSAFGWQQCFGDKPTDPCSDSSGWDHFEPVPCSRVGGLVSLISEGTTIEPSLSIIASGGAVAPPTSVISWGVAT